MRASHEARGRLEGGGCLGRCGCTWWTVDGGLTLRRDPVHYLLHTFLLSRLMGRVCGSVEKQSKDFYAAEKQVVLVRHGDTLRLFSFLPSAHVKRKHHLGWC